MAETEKQLNLVPLEIACIEHGKKKTIYPVTKSEGDVLEIHYKCGSPEAGSEACRTCRLNEEYRNKQHPIT